MKKFLNSSIPQFLKLDKKVILNKYLILTSFLMLILSQLNAQTFTGTVLRDPSNACTNNSNGAIPGTLITVSGSSTGNSTTTNSNGQYSVTYSSPNPQHDPLTLCASKFGVATDGLLLDDMMAVYDHIAATNCFTEKYQFLAADVNHNNTITTWDISIMNQVYTHYISDFDYNWYMFYTGEYNAFDIDISGCQNQGLPFEDNCIQAESGGTFNFVAVKVGDVAVSDIDCSAFEKKGKINARNSDKENVRSEVIQKNEIEYDVILNFEHDNLRYTGLELIFNPNLFRIKNIHSNLNNSELESFVYKIEFDKIRISCFNFQQHISRQSITISLEKIDSKIKIEKPFSLCSDSDFNLIFDTDKNSYVPILNMMPELENGYSLSIFENDLRIQGQHIKSIEIIDLMGRVIKNVNCTVPLNELTIDIGSIKGIALIRINKKITKRLIL